MAKARIAVVGAGLMGHGIAQVFALAGHEVKITDTVVKNLDTVASRIAANLRDLGEDESAVERVQPSVDLTDAVHDADYVVEAVSENLELKKKLFAELERRTRPDTILASNTSVIPITAIMQDLRERSRALGTHWWNPPFLVPLVEVIGTQWTSRAAIDWTMVLHAAAGKAAASPCSARSKTPTRSAPTSRWRSTTWCCRRSRTGRGRRPICKTWWPTASSASNPAKAFASGARRSRPRCAPG